MYSSVSNEDDRGYTIRYNKVLRGLSALEQTILEQGCQKEPEMALRRLLLGVSATGYLYKMAEEIFWLFVSYKMTETDCMNLGPRVVTSSFKPAFLNTKTASCTLF